MTKKRPFFVAASYSSQYGAFLLPFFGRRLPKILEKLIKALFEWFASLWYEMVEYLLDQILDLFHTDLTYFAERVPVINDIGTIFFAVGWALLIGNLVFQATRSMASGVGIEAEEPGRLFLRTGLPQAWLASRQGERQNGPPAPAAPPEAGSPLPRPGGNMT